VTTADNGREGLKRIEESRPALILLDLMMPEMDGFEFLQVLRRQPANERLPVIVLTAKELTVEERQRLNGKVADILQKGAYSKEQLLQEIRELVPPAPDKKAS
jgi:CheY-like chemotaxis protein